MTKNLVSQSLFRALRAKRPARGVKGGVKTYQRGGAKLYH